MSFYNFIDIHIKDNLIKKLSKGDKGKQTQAKIGVSAKYKEY